MHKREDDTASSGGPGTAELLRMVLESAVDYAIFSTDRAGLVTSWNSGAERVLGYAEQEILGRSADVIFTPEQREERVPDEERSMAQLAGRAEDERWQVRKGGERFWASGLMMPLSDRRQGYVKILRDRTDWHRADLERRREAERFRLLATNIPQLVFRCRGDGNRTWGSPQWIEFTGLGLSESLGLGWLRAIHPDDRRATRAAWAEAVRSGEYYVEHRVHHAADGGYRWHQTRARPVTLDESGPAVLREGDWVGTMSDVHELRSLQERQQVLLAELQHRTRNLLAVTHAIALQTLRTSSSLEAFGAQFEGRLRALGRVQGLLARLDAEEIDLRELVVEELRAHAADAQPDKVRVEGVAIGLPSNSAQAMGLALHELATNAVKYGALCQPGGRLAVTWRIEGEGAGRRLALDWRESGVAIADDGQPRRKGYGSELILRALPYQLDARTELVFTSHGVHCSIAIAIPQAGTNSDG